MPFLEPTGLFSWEALIKSVGQFAWLDVGREPEAVDGHWKYDFGVGATTATGVRLF